MWVNDTSAKNHFPQDTRIALAYTHRTSVSKHNEQTHAHKHNNCTLLYPSHQRVQARHPKTCTGTQKLHSPIPTAPAHPSTMKKYMHTNTRIALSYIHRTSAIKHNEQTHAHEHNDRTLLSVSQQRFQAQHPKRQFKESAQAFRQINWVSEPGYATQRDELRCGQRRRTTSPVPSPLTGRWTRHQAGLE